jgi:hypothetical protein
MQGQELLKNCLKFTYKHDVQLLDIILQAAHV